MPLGSVTVMKMMFYAVVSISFFSLSIATGWAQRLLPPEESEDRQRIERLEEIIRTDKDPDAVQTARCAVSLLRDEKLQPHGCADLKELGGRRATRAVRRRGAKRIVNGLTTAAYPSVGALLKGISQESAAIQCSGTLIACDKFLTAAHCVADAPNPQAYWTYFPSSGLYQVKKIEWPQQDYSAADDEADLAILTLDRTVTGILPMSINRSSNSIPYNIINSIVGFGRTGGSYSGGKIEDYGIKRVGYVQTAECKSSLAKERHLCWNFNSVIQGVELRSNTCNADSGGPLLNEDSGQLLIGLTTAGDKESCDRYDHSWDVDVRHWRDWIAQQGVEVNVRANCSSGQVASVSDHIVEETRRIDNFHPKIVYDIETLPMTKKLSVAMNGEDDGNGTNDFDLYLVDSIGKDVADAVCSQNGTGQFAYCEVHEPRPGPWRIVIQHKRGQGLVQTTVTRLR